MNNAKIIDDTQQPHIYVVLFEDDTKLRRRVLHTHVAYEKEVDGEWVDIDNEVQRDELEQLVAAHIRRCGVGTDIEMVKERGFLRWPIQESPET